MDKKIIVHVSEVSISPETGMGRVEYYWKRAFENAGYTFIHIGPSEVGSLYHRSLFPYKAYNYFKRLKIKPVAFIVHEPASGQFVKKGIPTFIESHGVERRGWEGTSNGSIPSTGETFKSRFFYYLLRLRVCDRGCRLATKLLLCNSDDREFVKKRYKRKDEDILVFKNGTHLNGVGKNIDVKKSTITKPYTVLFNGSWIERKGIHTIIEAAQLLLKDGILIEYLLIGTGKNEELVLSDWPKELIPFVKVIPNFKEIEEQDYLNSSSLFILPSYFEGQPLSLLQAMSAGKCCITTNCCGQKDIIDNGKNGFLFEAGDFEKLAELIKLCYNNSALVKEVGRNAQLHVQKFSWEKVSAELVDFVIKNT